MPEGKDYVSGLRKRMGDYREMISLLMGDEWPAGGR